MQRSLILSILVLVASTAGADAVKGGVLKPPTVSSPQKASLPQVGSPNMASKPPIGKEYMCRLKCGTAITILKPNFNLDYTQPAGCSHKLSLNVEKSYRLDGPLHVSLDVSNTAGSGRHFSRDGGWLEMDFVKIFSPVTLECRLQKIGAVHWESASYGDTFGLKTGKESDKRRKVLPADDSATAIGGGSKSGNIGGHN